MKSIHVLSAVSCENFYHDDIQRIWPISGQIYIHIETTSLIWTANQLTGFSIKVTLTLYGIKNPD